MMTVHLTEVGHAFSILFSASCELYDQPDLCIESMIESMERHFGSALSSITKEVGRLVISSKSLMYFLIVSVIPLGLLGIGYCPRGHGPDQGIFRMGPNK
ncbi:hypothetical protein Desti_3462 [Desulfomonile tiedjei DSM 6799]|uniref:Uncharacterized protein n=1 Tax=Desulfomonile tiedjei (strain ATCC 49306 / DSM 6799 / DCB-1) TaxID=706587 RepID=I4C972_DESTA|nr:hypothetical protein Desti_3462 [Desulfomonile tiedjei DSM 6799]